MRIALVSDCYPPRMGGIETQVSHLAARLRDHGHEVRVLTATHGEHEEGVVRLNAVPFGPPVNPWAGRSIHRVLAGADVVHIHLGVWAPFAQIAADIATTTGIPTVITWHSLVATSPLTAALRRRWRRWIARGALPSAVSSVAADQLGAALERAPELSGASSLGSPVAIMPNGTDLSAWSRGALATDGRHTHRPRVASAMRFTARKRPLGLVSMISRVRANLPPEHRPALVICGDGPLLRPLRAAVAASSLRDWVELPGRLSAPELAGVYRASSVYVAPARHEAFGIAALEAAAAGLPVMGYAGSGVRDIVERSGIDGLLAESDRDMFQMLVSLFSEPERLLDLTADLPAHSLCRHRWPHVTDVSIALYQRAIADR